MKKFFKKDSGFSLMEILIVIAIVLVLITVSIVVFQTIRRKSDEAQQLADITQIKAALEKNYSSQGKYAKKIEIKPNGIDVGGNFVNLARLKKLDLIKICNDQTQQSFTYDASPDSNSYVLKVCLDANGEQPVVIEPTVGVVGQNSNTCVSGQTSQSGCVQLGICQGAYKTCIDGTWSSCNIRPQPEDCNLKDNNCDGAIDLQVDGGWTDWVCPTAWSDGDCNGTTCKKTQSRVCTRTCTNPKPACGGKDCDGDLTKTDTQDVDCGAINGGWGSPVCGSWANSGDCTNGQQLQTQSCVKACNTPIPACGGVACTGVATSTGNQYVACNQNTTTPCTAVPGGWSDWSIGNWTDTSDCNSSTLTKTQTRTNTRTCNNPTPSCNGNQCVGDTSATENATASCTPTTTPCTPVDGGWSATTTGDWASTGACNEFVDCMQRQTRVVSRTCTDPTPYCNGKDCVGAATSTETQDIVCGDSVNYYPDTDGDGFGDASSTPTKTCKLTGGFVVNNLDCNDKDVTIHPGATEVCNSEDDNCDGQIDENLKVNGGWGAWGQLSGWQNDTSTCGQFQACQQRQVQVQTRACNSPASFCGGADCVGSAVSSTEQFITCATGQWYRDADNDGFGNPFTVDTNCQQPTGYVANPNDCNDTNAQISPSSTPICTADPNADVNCNNILDNLEVKKDGGWSAWATSTVWTDSGVCGEFTDCQQRQVILATRDCTNPAPFCNGAACVGATSTIAYTRDQVCAAPTVWFRDADGDGHGTPNFTLSNCAKPVGYATSSDDCNDADATVYTGAPEPCDGRDHNCDGQPAVQTRYYQDADGDSYGNASSSQLMCATTTGWTLNTTDCNDTNKAINPAATEICDSIDNNCNGQIDEGVKQTFYRDFDGDGFGGNTTGTLACVAPTGWVNNNSDCVDENVTPCTMTDARDCNAVLIYPNSVASANCCASAGRPKANGTVCRVDKKNGECDKQATCDGTAVVCAENYYQSNERATTTVCAKCTGNSVNIAPQAASQDLFYDCDTGTTDATRCMAPTCSGTGFTCGYLTPTSTNALCGTGTWQAQTAGDKCNIKQSTITCDGAHYSCLASTITGWKNAHAQGNGNIWSGIGNGFVNATCDNGCATGTTGIGCNGNTITTAFYSCIESVDRQSASCSTGANNNTCLSSVACDYKCSNGQCNNDACYIGSPPTYYGKTYRRVSLGGRCWLSENLITDRDRTGNCINGGVYPNCNPNGVGTARDCITNTNPPGRGTEADCQAGRTIYNLSSLPYYAGSICPPGYHIPSLIEWNLTNTSLSDSNTGTCYDGQTYNTGCDVYQTTYRRCCGTGTKLKIAGQCADNSTSTCGTSGFNADLIGYRTGNNDFSTPVGVRYTGFWTSSFISYSQQPQTYILANNSAGIVLQIPSGNSSAYSIRCVVDDLPPEPQIQPQLTNFINNSPGTASFNMNFDTNKMPNGAIVLVSTLPIDNKSNNFLSDGSLDPSGQSYNFTLNNNINNSYQVMPVIGLVKYTGNILFPASIVVASISNLPSGHAYFFKVCAFNENLTSAETVRGVNFRIHDCPGGSVYINN